MQDAWRAYLGLALGATEASKKQAQKVAKKLVGKGGIKASQLQYMAEDLYATSTANREALTKLVRFEVDRALGVVGLATADEVADLTQKVRDLEAELRTARAGAAPAASAASPAAPAAPAPAGRTVAKKTVAKKASARKAPAKKAAPAATVADSVAAAAPLATPAPAATKPGDAAKAAPARKAPAKAAAKAPAKGATKTATGARKAPAKKATGTA